jgi:hypothetical protein
VTTTAGEIIVLDSGGYGSVTINKSVAIVAPSGVYAGISVFTVGPLAGVVVNAGDSGFVTLRGLSLVNLAGVTGRGINVISAAHVRIEACTLDGFEMGVWSHGNTASIAVTDTTIRGRGYQGAGIQMEGTYDARLVVTHSVIHNTWSGINVENVHHAEITETTLAYCSFAGVSAVAYADQPDNGSLVLERVALLENGFGISLVGNAPRQMVANVRNSTISGNQLGAFVQNGGYLRLAGTQVTANHTAIAKSGSGVLYSLGDNVCEGNDAPCIAATPIAPY